MSIRETSNATQVSADIAAYAEEAHLRVRREVTLAGARLQGGVKRRANAPRGGPAGPEPRLQTGDYNRSINRRAFTEGTSFGVSVGTNRPQARRLELGFVGADSLGRVYDDPPRPHFGPALDEEGPRFLAAVEKAVQP